eukprot:SAG31_NODE_1485_length_8151_cov_6.486215_5_plen_234_part_00
MSFEEPKVTKPCCCTAGLSAPAPMVDHGDRDMSASKTATFAKAHAHFLPPFAVFFCAFPALFCVFASEAPFVAATLESVSFMPSPQSQSPGTNPLKYLKSCCRRSTMGFELAASSTSKQRVSSGQPRRSRSLIVASRSKHRANRRKPLQPERLSVDSAGGNATISCSATQSRRASDCRLKHCANGAMSNSCETQNKATQKAHAWQKCQLSTFDCPRRTEESKCSKYDERASCD